jgi:integrator complex subunit 7
MLTEKILNLDEFIRRIYNVTYSNDPIARALTLRTLGVIACVSANRKHVQHTIRDRLDSDDEVEVQAAIEAAAWFSRQNAEFALSIYPKIVALLSQAQHISPEARQSLLGVLHHQHYNSDTAADVRRRCLSFLSESPNQRFVAAVLHTLTYISITSLSQIPEQIQLLLTHLRQTQKSRLQTCLARELHTLANQTPHLWTKQNVGELLDICNIRSATFVNLLTLSSRLIEILKCLLRCPCLLSGQPDSVTEFHVKVNAFSVALIQQTSTDNFQNKPNALGTLSNSLALLTELSRHHDSTRATIVPFLKQYLTQTSKETFVPTDDYADCTLHAYRRLCKCVVSIANLERTFAEQLVACIEQVMEEETLSSVWLGLMCETLCSIKHKQHAFQDIARLEGLVEKYAKQREDCDSSALCGLFTLYFQVLATRQISCVSKCDVIEYVGPKNAWFYFKLGRQAMRYGHNEISKRIFQHLQHCTGNENLHFWIVALLKISKAECLVSTKCTGSAFEQSISDSIAIYAEAIFYLQTAHVSGHSLQFASEYIRLRSRFLHTHLMLIKFCRLLQTSPAASASTLIALNSRDDLLRCGPIVLHMRQNCKDFRKLAQEYSELYHTSFNADHSTLVHLQLLQHCCTIIAEATEAVFQTNRLGTLFITQDHNQIPIDQVLPEHQHLWNVCSSISEQVKKQIIESTQSGSSCSVAPETGTMLTQQVKTLLQISRNLVLVPQTPPRFFFQRLQSSCIKLAVSPSPKAGPNESVLTIGANVNFALKVEGVIVHSDQQTSNALNRPEVTVEQDEQRSLRNIKANCLIRKAAKVLLQINSQCTNRTTNPSMFGLTDQHKLSTSVSLQSLVEPRNDYFQAQFLLVLCAGHHSITVEAFIIDEQDAQWKTGTQSSLVVRVLD